MIRCESRKYSHTNCYNSAVTVTGQDDQLIAGAWAACGSSGLYVFSFGARAFTPSHLSLFSISFRRSCNISERFQAIPKSNHWPGWPRKLFNVSQGSFAFLFTLVAFVAVGFGDAKPLPLSSLSFRLRSPVLVR